MDKKAIASLLQTKHNNLFTFLKNQNSEDWIKGPDGKWTTGQHALHLLQSIIPLNKALSYPKFILKYKFGKANRPSRDYDTVISKYKNKIKEAKGLTYGPSKNMKVPSLDDKRYLLNRLEIQNKKLQHKLLKCSDKDLDTVILPHPLMGKMTAREIIMWTAFHVEHHTKTLKEKY